MGFKETLAAWITRSGLRHADFQEAVGKSRGYIGRVIKGELPPPDREACEIIGELLVERGVIRSASEVWDEASRERLETGLRERFGDDLTVTIDRDSLVTPREVELLGALHRLQGRVGHYDPLDALRGLLEAALEDRYGTDGAQDLHDTLFLLARLDPTTLHRRLRDFVALLAGETLVANVRDRGGDVAREIDASYFDRPIVPDES